VTFPAPTGLVGSNPAGLQVDLSWAIPAGANSSLLLHFDLTPTPYTSSLLLHCDGVNGSQVFIDSSSVGNVMTSAANGATAPTVETANSKFGSGAALLPGGAGTITTPIASNGPLDLNGDFTIECWVNTQGFFGSGIIADALVGATKWGLTCANGTTYNFALFRISGGGSIGVGGPITVVNGAWHAIAAVRSGNTLTLYIDGVAGTPGTFSGTVNVTSGVLVIGSNTSVGGGAIQNGLVDEIRITQSALYTANYTPSAVPLAATGTFPAATIVDSSGTGNIMTANGTSAIGTVVTKFGTGSLSPADATSDPLSSGNVSTPVTAGGPLDLSTGDFTIECWVHPNFNDGFARSFISALNNAPAAGYSIGEAFNSVVFAFGAGSVGISGTLPIGVWSAIAAVRKGDVFAVFVNGVSTSTPVTQPGSIGLSALGILRIGGDPHFTFHGFYGQIDEVRITKGAALFTPGVNYTPVTSAFPDGGAPPGYDVYRGGVSIARFAGAITSYVDTVPSAGAYVYTVACWDGVSTDVSPQSSPFNITIFGTGVPSHIPGGGPGSGGLINWVGNTGFLTAKFVAPKVGKAIMQANPGTINPRAYVPEDDTTIIVPQPRLPL
jgi:hypothetical protein